LVYPSPASIGQERRARYCGHVSKTNRNLKPHPLAKLFPKYGEEELLDLASDIAANGLHNPIVLYQGQILDGVNRHQVSPR
jgi:hypothetical protein